MKQYELYFIINPELSSEQTTTVVDQVKALVETDLNGKNVTIDQEGLKKLAYPIQKFQTGFYTSVKFEVEDGKVSSINNFEKKFNLFDKIMRYILVDLTKFNKELTKEERNNVDVKNHRELNKGFGAKKDITNFLGIEAVNYKDVDYLNQFTSPYAKIFIRTKTGSTAKNQRKITRAIKRARHMALMPFTPKGLS
jgi:ribosomal protein S18/ribosomal protein S6